MNKKRLTYIIALLSIAAILITLDGKLISILQDKKSARTSQTENLIIYSLTPAQLKPEIASLQKQMDAMPIKVRPASEKNTWITQFSAKAVQYQLDIISLTPSEGGISSSGLEKQSISLDLLGSYKNTLFLLDDLIRSGQALTVSSLSMRCERPGEPVKTHAEIQILWSAE